MAIFSVFPPLSTVNQYLHTDLERRELGLAEFDGIYHKIKMKAYV